MDHHCRGDLWLVPKLLYFTVKSWGRFVVIITACCVLVSPKQSRSRSYKSPFHHNTARECIDLNRGGKASVHTTGPAMLTTRRPVCCRLIQHVPVSSRTLASQRPSTTIDRLIPLTRSIHFHPAARGHSARHTTVLLNDSAWQSSVFLCPLSSLER